MNGAQWLPGPLLIGLVVVGISAEIAFLAYIVFRGWKSSRLSRKRSYAQSKNAVYASVLAAVEHSRFTVVDTTDQTISVAPGYLGGTYVGPLLPPVMHVVVLPTVDGGTQLEVIGGHGLSDAGWHMMAQELLNEIDQQLDPGAR